MFAHTVAIPESHLPEAWDALWSAIPTTTAVFALYGPDAASEPYITKTANLRRRLKRLLSPDATTTKRLNLRGRVHQIAFTETCSDFETALLLYSATRRFFGERARKRLHLRSPALLRYTEKNAYPRLYVTHRVSLRGLEHTYGPFPSRVAAERYLEESLNLFLLRRCVDDLHPDPAFPGCIYSEMKMCLAPCFQGCSDERYAAEAGTVRDYFATRGASLLTALERDRNAASTALDFEKAAQIHSRLQKVKAIAQQAAPLVHPLAHLDAVIVQPATLTPEAEQVAIFRLRAGVLFGPAMYSVQGMLHPNEQSGSSSLFAHPPTLAPTPLLEVDVATAKASRNLLEDRLRDLLHTLDAEIPAGCPHVDCIADHLAIVARWYYRPAAKRTGEIFFSDVDGNFSLPKILRGISRVFRGAKDPEALAAGAPETIAISTPPLPG